MTMKERNDDGQPYFARATFMRLCLPAVLYSLVSNVSLKLLSFVPFTSRFRIGVEKLHPKDCFVPNNLPSPGGDGDKSNSIAIVTGSNTGVGFETAAGLAERGYHVILACRSRVKGEAAADRINRRLESLKDNKGNQLGSRHFVRGGSAFFFHPLDLASFASVRSFCGLFSEKYNYLNVLVNNAGISSQGDVTEDGLEICFQSNFVGHFLLTKLLMKHLLKAKNRYQPGTCNEEEAGRIVNLSSVTHHFAPANERKLSTTDSAGSKNPPLNSGIHDQDFWLGSASPGLSSSTYRESKLAAILFSMELNKRYGGRGIRSIAANPGSVSSDIWRNESSLMRKLYTFIHITPQQGASTSLAGAIGAIPKDDTIYLQPYWQPELQRGKDQSTTSISSFRLRYGLPFPMTEILGPYVGCAITEPRLPVDGYTSSQALWNACEQLTSVGKDSRKGLLSNKVE